MRSTLGHLKLLLLESLLYLVLTVLSIKIQETESMLISLKIDNQFLTFVSVKLHLLLARSDHYLVDSVFNISLSITGHNVRVSSTYFQACALETLKSLIIKMNSQGPSLVPCGTPAGTGPHSEKQSADNFTRCCLCVKKSATQQAMG